MSKNIAMLMNKSADVIPNPTNMNMAISLVLR